MTDSPSEDRLLALAQFGALVLNESRSELADLDGGWLQETAVACGLLESVEVDGPCEEPCRCAEYGDFPMNCYRKTEAAKALDPVEMCDEQYCCLPKGHIGEHDDMPF